MPFDNAGNASLPPSTWAVAGQTIRTEQHNPPFRDIEAMLSSVLIRDGRAGMVGPLQMGGFPITGLGSSADPSAAATVGQTQNSAPVGSVICFAGANLPNGWLLCYGQAVSRADFPDLFSTIGTLYGNGDGATTFNVPDFRGTAPVGRDNMGGTPKGLLSKFAATVLGSIFGVQEKILTNLNIPRITGSVEPAGSHSHSYTYYQGSTRKSGTDTSIDTTSTARTGTTSTAPSHTHSFSIGEANPAAVPVVQPSIVMNFIIRASYT